MSSLSSSLRSKKTLDACKSECEGHCDYLDDMIRGVPELSKIFQKMSKTYEKEKQRKDNAPLAMIRCIQKTIEQPGDIFEVWMRYKSNYAGIVEEYKKQGKGEKDLDKTMARFVACVVSRVNDEEKELSLSALQMFVTLSNVMGNKYTVHFNTHMMKHLDSLLKNKEKTRLCTKEMTGMYKMYEDQGMFDDM